MSPETYPKTTTTKKLVGKKSKQVFAGHVRLPKATVVLFFNHLFGDFPSSIQQKQHDY